MTIKRRPWEALPWAVVALVLSAEALADDPPAAGPPRARSKRLQSLIEESVGWYQLLPQADSQTPMRPETVMRWINASRGQQGEDILVLWVHEGRPEAAATIFPWEGHLCHEFASLSRAGRLIAKDGDAVVWSPNAAGAEFRDVPDAPAPAEMAAARLRQMKSLAERFKATLTGLNADNSDREELRLLPRAVCRYNSAATASSNPDLQDGAVFAFVQGTDPEVLLLLESVRQDNRFRWQYPLARATAGGLEARLNGDIVWTAERFPNNRVPTKPTIALWRAIDE
jgi:hypothetical protein